MYTYSFGTMGHLHTERIKNAMKRLRAEGKEAAQTRTQSDVLRATEMLYECFRSGGKVLACGNGGSAEQAKHLVTELTGKIRRHRPGLPAIALGQNVHLMTAVANDFSFNQIFAHELDALGQAGDVLFAFSTSGSSPNVVEAVRVAKKRGLKTIGLLGAGGALRTLVDLPITVASPVTPRVQEVHLRIIHNISELIEDLLFNRDELLTIVERFAGKRVGVIGDVLLNRFVRGDVERISPEAPVPVVLLRHEACILGGAGTTAMNVAALGGRVTLVGEIGEDEAGRRVLEVMRQWRMSPRGILRSAKRSTAEEVRIASGQHQIVWLDRGVQVRLDARAEREAFKFIAGELPKWDAVILTDYATGMLPPRLLSRVIALAKRHGKPVVGDTKPGHLPHFKGVTLITPNRKEAEEFTGIKLVDHAAVERAGIKIQNALNASVLVTRGPDGMSLFHGGERTHILPARVRQVFDVSGAGDTVVATAALALAAGGTMLQASEIASHAGGISVEKPGTSTVSPDELTRSLQWA